MTTTHPAAVALGRLGGSARTKLKAAAARANARLGGWPKGRPRRRPATAPPEPGSPPAV